MTKIGKKAIRKELFTLKGEKCEVCGISDWQGHKLILQIHHIDGNNSNNEKSNLQILCPNCHSITDSFYGKRNSGKQKYSNLELKEELERSKNIHQALKNLGLNTGRENYIRCREIILKYGIETLYPKSEGAKETRCSNCGIIIGNCKTGLCLNCYSLSTRISERPTREILKKEIRQISFLALGKKYNVSDNAIRKWCIFYNLPYQKKKIKQYSNEEWNSL